MAHIVADRVMETSTTTGTGSFALGGAYTGYQAFDDAMANGDTCYYCIEAIDANGNPSGAWEVGLGTFNDTDTLVRTTPSASSNGGAAVNFAAGTKRVMLTPSAARIASFYSSGGTDVAVADGGTGASTAAGARTNLGLDFRGCLVRKSVDQTAADYATASNALTWDQETYDTDAIHGLASTVTITIASPGVVTWTGHNFENGSPIVLTTTGALPTGLTAGTTYYVVNKGTNTFQLSATSGGSAINTTGSQSGVHTATNNSRLTVPSGASYVRISANVAMSSVTADVWCALFIRKNNAAFDGRGLTYTEIGFTSVGLNCSTAIVPVVPGDYFDVTLQVETDTSVTVVAAQSWFAMEIVA